MRHPVDLYLEKYPTMQNGYVKSQHIIPINLINTPFTLLP